MHWSFPHDAFRALPSQNGYRNGYKLKLLARFFMTPGPLDREDFPALSTHRSPTQHIAKIAETTRLLSVLASRRASKYAIYSVKTNKWAMGFESTNSASESCR
jgi:hypothetical protein